MMLMTIVMMPLRNIDADVRVNVRSRKSRMGSTGSAARCSTRRNAARPARPSTSRASIFGDREALAVAELAVEHSDVTHTTMSTTPRSR